jgi:peroxiredoxin
VIQVGDKIPAVSIKEATPEGAIDIDVAQRFAGKRVVMFSIVGAFTGDCTLKHLPSYLEELPALRARGVDLVACLAVNDVDVLRAWALQHDALGKIVMLADGSAKLTKALGIELDLTPFGMGVRADRGVMIVEDGIVRSIEIEKPLQFEVSSAAACLRRLAPT